MWDVFKDWIFSIIQFFYNICGDWGLAIIIVTIIFRIIVWPLMHKQAKSSFQMQKIQPKIKEIQERYSDDKVRMQQEMQKLYADAKFNPLAGCLPMLLQMPIFIALFQVLREMGDREEVHDFTFYNIVNNLIMSPSTAFSEGMGTFVPYLFLLIIFAGATFLPMVMMQLKSNNVQQRNQTLLMGGIMTVFMLWIGWGTPAGVLLFWGTSSVIGIGQNQLALYHCRLDEKKTELEQEGDITPVDIIVTRKEKKKRPTKKR